MKHKARVTIKVKGGPGSGNWGHRGIPGKVGGSSPRGIGAVAIGGVNTEATLSKYPTTLTADDLQAIGMTQVAVNSDPDIAREARRYNRGMLTQTELKTNVANIQRPIHNVKLPENKKKLTIAKTALALSQMNYKLGRGHFDLATKTSSYTVTLPDGTNKRMQIAEIHKLIYESAAT